MFPLAAVSCRGSKAIFTHAIAVEAQRDTQFRVLAVYLPPSRAKGWRVHRCLGYHGLDVSQRHRTDSWPDDRVRWLSSKEWRASSGYSDD